MEVKTTIMSNNDTCFCLILESLVITDDVVKVSIVYLIRIVFISFTEPGNH